MKKKSKDQFLKRPRRFMLRFNDAELRDYRSRARKSGLSQVEYGRRKILDIPVVEVARPAEQEPSEFGAKV